MDKGIGDKVFLKLKEDIDALCTDNALDEAKAALALVKAAFAKLSKSDSNDQFLVLEMYYRELLWLEHNKPIAHNFELMAYYSRELEYTRHFFTRHPAQYQEYKTEALEMEDEVTSFKSDKAFSVQFTAYEKLQHYLVKRLSELEQVLSLAAKTRGGLKLQWTGEICNLVELAYGLYETGQINCGQVALTDIFRCLGDFFQMDLHRGYRHYTDIKGRKRLSQTRFLDQMRNAVLNRIEQENAYVPPVKK
jgi:hypothetical protein